MIMSLRDDYKDMIVKDMIIRYLQKHAYKI